MGIAVDSAGDIRIADYDTHQVLNFTNSGTLIFQTGSIGQGPGQFSHPTGVAVDAQGHTLVADAGSSRVQILDPNLNLITAFGNSTLYDGWNNNLLGLYTSADGHIYVVDSLEDDLSGRLSIFDSTGKLTFRRRFADSVGLSQSVQGLQKTSVAVASDGSIFVYVPGVPNIEECPVMYKFDSQLNELLGADADCSRGGGALDGDF